MYNSSIFNSAHTYSIIVSLKFILVNNYLNESELEPGENLWLVIETTNFMPTENCYHIELGIGNIQKNSNILYRIFPVSVSTFY